MKEQQALDVPTAAIAAASWHCFDCLAGSRQPDLNLDKVRRAALAHQAKRPTHAISIGTTYEAQKVRRCRGCGCTERHACRGGCYWIALNLCSRCESTSRKPTPARPSAAKKGGLPAT